MDREELLLYEDQNMSPTTLRDIAIVGFRHKRAILLSFLAVLAGALAVGLLWPSYQSETELLLVRDRVDPIVSPSQSAPVIINNTVTDQEVNSEVELLKSTDVLRQVVLASGLDQTLSLSEMLRQAFGLSSAHEKKIQKAILKLRDALQIEAVDKSNVIKISYASTNSHLPARVLSALDAAYLQKHNAVHRPAGQYQFFEQQTERYRKQLAEAEVRLKEFSKQSRIANPQLARDISLQKLSDYKVNLGQTQAAIAETEHRIKELENLGQTTAPRVTTQLRQADDAEVLQQLKTALLNLQLKKVELSTRYQPNYPLLQEVEQQLADTEAAIAKEEAKPLRDQTTDQNPAHSWIDEELVKASTDLRGYRAREAAIHALVRDNLESVLHLDQAGVAEQDLVRNVKAAEDEYLLYLHKREEARITDALDQSQILNVSIAEQPSTPLLPRMSPFLVGVIGLVLASVVSCGTALTLEYTDRTFRTPAEVEGLLKVPLLAAVPYQLPSNSADHKDQLGSNGVGQQWERTV